MVLFWKVQVEWVTDSNMSDHKRQQDPSLDLDDFNMPYQEASEQLLFKVFRRLCTKFYHALNITNLGMVLVFLEANYTC